MILQLRTGVFFYSSKAYGKIPLYCIKNWPRIFDTKLQKVFQGYQSHFPWRKDKITVLLQLNPSNHWESHYYLTFSVYGNYSEYIQYEYILQHERFLQKKQTNGDS